LKTKEWKFNNLHLKIQMSCQQAYGVYVSKHSFFLLGFWFECVFAYEVFVSSKKLIFSGILIWVNLETFGVSILGKSFVLLGILIWVGEIQTRDHCEFWFIFPSYVNPFGVIDSSLLRELGLASHQEQLVQHIARGCKRQVFSKTLTRHEMLCQRGNYLEAIRNLKSL
jgi:hypothetical protein